MPSALLSHQAPGLAIKLKAPRLVDGTALCLGTMIPDLNAVVEICIPMKFNQWTQSLVGLIIWTIPIAMVMTIVFCKYIAPLVGRIASWRTGIVRPLRYFGVDDWGLLKRKRYTQKWVLVAFYSAMLGGLTHLLLDIPAHADIFLLYPWFSVQVPEALLYVIADFGTVTIGTLQITLVLTIYTLIWLLESVLGLVVTLILLRYIKKRQLMQQWYENESKKETIEDP